MLARKRPIEPFMVSGSPKMSAALPISQGDQMSPRKWTAKVETANAAARMLGWTTLAMIAVHGPVLTNIKVSAAKIAA